MASLLSPEKLSAATPNFSSEKDLKDVIVSEDLEFRNGQYYTVKLFVSKPKSASHNKAILIGHGYGETTYLKYTATRLALEGYVAIAILEEKLTDGIDEKSITSKGDLWKSTIEYIFTKDYVMKNQLALLGFCGAGTKVLKLSAEKDFVKVAISIYGNVN